MREALLILALSASGAAAESGRTAAPFLQRSLGAQAAGMGTAFTAVRGSIDSLQYNPSGAATLKKRTAASSYLKGFGEASHGYFAYAHPTRLGTFAGSFLYYNAGTIALNLSDGTQNTVTAEENIAWTGTYARHLAYGLHAGATYRHLRLKLAETASASSSQTDLGLLWKTPLPGLSLGAAYQYLGPDITYESAGNPPPKTARFGAAFHFPEVDAAKLDPSVDLEEMDATISIDDVAVLREKNSPRFGLELGLTSPYARRFALRAGWVAGRDVEGLTLGIGFRQGVVGVDYAFGSSSELGHQQHVSLTFVF